jgi:hypothetical protein
LFLSTPTDGHILQASMFSSPEKPFDLPVYAEAMARASPPTRPHCDSRGRNVDPRVQKFLDLDASVDASIPVDCSDPESSFTSSADRDASSDSESSPMSGTIFQRRLPKSRPSSDDSTSQSS